MNKSIFPRSLITLLVLAACCSEALKVLAQPSNSPNEQQTEQRKRIQALDNELDELNQAIVNAHPANSMALSIRAEGLARQYFNLHMLPSSDKAWALAIKSSSNSFRQSAIYTLWSNQEGKVDLKHVAQLKESALKVLDKEVIALPMKQDTYRDLIYFYRAHNEACKANKLQAQFAKLMGTDDPKILFRKRAICLGCGMG